MKVASAYLHPVGWSARFQRKHDALGLGGEDLCARCRFVINKKVLWGSARIRLCNQTGSLNHWYK